MSNHIQLLQAIHAVKHLPRKGWLERGLPAGRVESVGAHTFGTALLALLLKEAGVLPAWIPAERLLAVSLLHDITEGLTGDVTPADGVAPARKAEMEVDAARRLLGAVPGMGNLQRELEAFASAGDAAGGDPVHALVRQIDKLDMMIQALQYEKAWGNDMADFYDDPRKYLSDPALLRYFEEAKRAIIG
ncbi:MAG: HD domain-containing protein [Candidatus Lokiarchaeota archaeon]|nr:HD domain-containing protein [Candidatus Lokiarchaeota archaeon]